MNPDYIRRVSCVLYLQRIFEYIYALLRSVDRVSTKDFGPHSRTPPQLSKSLHFLASEMVKQFMDLKKRKTSARHSTESPTILKVLAEYEKIQSEIDKEIIGALVTAPPKNNHAAKQILDKVKRRTKKLLEATEKCLDSINNERDALVNQYNPSDGGPKSAKEKKENGHLIDPCYVVSVDLARYGELSTAHRPEKLFDLNLEIIENIDTAIEAAGSILQDTIVSGAGDGALVFFKNPNAAIEFTVELAKLTKTQNNSVDNEDFRHEYRVGIAKGPVFAYTVTNPLSRSLLADVAGTAIARAVRLQTQASSLPGFSVLIQDEVTRDVTKKKLKALFSQVNVIDLNLKPHEKELVEKKKLRKIQAVPLQF